jgi:phosphopantothenoylcysteine decarboxylase/phosphopantothenate--cysteine ligase
VRIVVTAGPTREPLDPVRYLSNRSSGKMGYAIAEAAIADGHEVVLISGPVNIAPPRGAKLISILTADEMFDAVHRQVPNCDALVMCAAVADYKPVTVSEHKLKKSDAPISLSLVPTRDILASLPKQDRRYFVAGFAAETRDLETNAQKKLREKNCDIVVANDVSAVDVGMESDENAVTIFFRNGESKKMSRTSKKNIAHELIKIISNARENRLTKKSW